MLLREKPYFYKEIIPDSSDVEHEIGVRPIGNGRYVVRLSEVLLADLKRLAQLRRCTPESLIRLIVAQHVRLLKKV